MVETHAQRYARRYPDKVRASKARFNARNPTYQNDRYWWGRALLTAVKLGAGCIDCGYDEWPEALEFDHIEGLTKKREPSNMVLAAETTIWEYLKDCVVRCANCHRTKQRRTE